MYNDSMEEKLFTAEYTPEAKQQLYELAQNYQDKILSAVGAFELLGTDYKNINKLDFNLYEIKPTGVRAYFKYDTERKRIIIIGLVVLKKTQEAPKRYMKQAVRNIENYIRSKQDDDK